MKREEVCLSVGRDMVERGWRHHELQERMRERERQRERHTQRERGRERHRDTERETESLGCSCAACSW